MFGIVLSNMIIKLIVYKLMMKKLVGMCICLFFFIIVIMMVLLMIEKKMMRNKKDVWIYFLELVKIWKLYGEVGCLIVVMF